MLQLQWLFLSSFLFSYATIVEQQRKALWVNLHVHSAASRLETEVCKAAGRKCWCERVVSRWENNMPLYSFYFLQRPTGTGDESRYTHEQTYTFTSDNSKKSVFHKLMYIRNTKVTRGRQASSVTSMQKIRPPLDSLHLHLSRESVTVSPMCPEVKRPQAQTHYSMF